MSIYIFEFAYVALCLFMPVCWARMHAHTHTNAHASCVFVCSCYCVCVPVVVLEWNTDILPLS